MPYLLAHRTTRSNAKSILESGFIKQDQETNFGEGFVYKKPYVFFTLLFKEYLFHIPTREDEIIFFLNYSGVVDQAKPDHLCTIWTGGNLVKPICSKYDKFKTATQNAKQWETLLRKSRPRFNPMDYIYGPEAFHAHTNEIVFDASISLDALVFLYDPKTVSKRALMKFLKSNDYNNIDFTHSPLYDTPNLTGPTDLEVELAILELLRYLKRKKGLSKTWTSWQHTPYLLESVYENFYTLKA